MLFKNMQFKVSVRLPLAQKLVAERTPDRRDGDGHSSAKSSYRISMPARIESKTPASNGVRR